MAHLFRRYFWLLSAACALLASLLAAKAVSLYAELALAPPILGTTSPFPSDVKAKDSDQTASAVALDGASLARVTGLRFGQPPPAVVEGHDTLDPAMPRSTLPVRLLGTLVARDAAWSLASLQASDTQRARSYLVGDELLGARIVSIERTRVVVSRDGHEEFIDGQAQPGMRPAASPALARATPTAAPGREAGSWAVGEHAYEVPQAELQGGLARMDDLLTQARAVPSIRDGKVVGFKVSAIKAGSLYTKLGLQNGDTLRRINGLDLDAPDKVLEVFNTLREARHIELDLDRGGSAVRKVYDVR